MRLHKHFFASFFAALILTLHMAAAESPAAKLKVGFIGSFSGPAQVYGIACRNGFELALSEGAKEGLAVSFEDDLFSPAKTVAAFKKLTQIDGVDVVIVIGSTPSNAVAPIAQRQGVPLIGWASDPKVALGRSYVIRSYPSGSAEGRQAANEALRRNLGRFALFVSQNDYTLSWRDGVLEALPPRELLIDERMTGRIGDLKPLVLKAKAAGAENFALCLDPGELGLFAKQLRELKLRGGLIGCEYFHDRDEVIASQNALVGGFFATLPIEPEFHAKYKNRFNNDSIISGAANHYDLAWILNDVRRVKDKAGIVKAIIGLGKRRGAVGEFRVTEQNGDRFFDIPLVIKEITADGYKVIDRAGRE